MDLTDQIDRTAIVDTTVRYCWALDERDWDALGSVFTSDATANLNGTSHVGLGEIVARISGTLDPLDASQHVVTNHQVMVSGDTATCRCYLHAQHVRAAAVGGELYVAAGRYEDQLVRTPDGWRITHRNLILSWTDGNRGVVHP